MNALNRKICFLIIVITIFLCGSTVIAETNFNTYSLDSKYKDQEIVSISTAWPVDRIRPGDHVVLAVILNIKDEFHINADSGQLVSFDDFKPYPTQIQVIKAFDAITIQSPIFPCAHPVKVDYAQNKLMFFQKQTIIYLPMKLDETVKPGERNLELEISYQACNTKTCFFPQNIILKQSLPVSETDMDPIKINQDIFAQYNKLSILSPVSSSKDLVFDLFGWSFSINVLSGTGLILILLIAAFGGFLLNFTPCVLPLVPVKIMSLLNAGEQDQKKSIILGGSMFSGVFIFWVCLGLMIALVSGFTAANQLFQYPFFTITIGVIIAIMGIGMFGLFDMPVPDFVYKINPDQTRVTGAFVLGILTGILSTPCTAPFMGSAAAWAATQHPGVSLSVFAAIGTGMAIPYLILSVKPGLLKKLPKTGQASILLKQIMGLFMLAVAAFFIGTGVSSLIVSPPNPPSKIYWWPVVFFCAAAGVWLAYQVHKISNRKKIRGIFISIGIIIIIVCLFSGFKLTKKGGINWQYYTPQIFDQAISNKKTIVMVFSAEWCLNCKALEHGVLENPRITKLLAHKNIIPVKVDITGNNRLGKAKLKETGSLTIPLLVVYSPDGKIVFKSDFYTVEQIEKAVLKATLKKKD